MGYNPGKWRNCTLCPLHKTRNKVVQYRGDLPARVVFIGEAPGMAEDLTGSPFVGPAGLLLDDILEVIQDETGERLSYAITNVVCCIPKQRGELRQPFLSEIDACSPRLESFLEAADPSLIVLVGETARKTFEENYEVQGIRCIHVLHPAAILRQPEEIQVVSIHKVAAAILHALED